MTNKIIKRPEILAPCGSYDILIAAINAGCDACYVGGSRFSARAYAENIASDSIIKSIDYAHLHNVRLYLTINTLFKDNEINDLYDFLKPYYEAGLDAVIVQDLGVFNMVRRLFPDIDVHLSTQMNITSKHAAAYMRELGASRVVTAREMSLDEIKQIKNAVDIELEVFVHGAMCYSYSGQCLMSSLAGGRSGNRGRCAQPCRKCYDNEYILSMKDMCSLTNIPDLIDAGIDSLKIEGRMKNAYYVASAVDAYKEMCEDYLAGKFSIKKANQAKERLANVYNRGGFSAGYFFTAKGPDMITPERPGNTGVCIGTVKSVQQGKVHILLNNDLYKQDVLLLPSKGGEDIEITSPIQLKSGQTAVLNAPKTRQIILSGSVYRTRCSIALEDINRQLISNNKKTDLYCKFEGRIGNPIILSARAFVGGKEYETSVKSDYIVEASDKKPADFDDIRKKLGQLNDTGWRLDELIFNVDEKAFIPAGEIKKLRRALLEKIEGRIVASYRRMAAEDNNAYEVKRDATEALCKINSEIKTDISLMTIEQLRAVSEFDCINSVYLSKAVYIQAKQETLLKKLKEKNIKIVIKLPHVIRSDFDIISHLKDIDYDGIYIRNIDGLICALSIEESSNCEIICASSLYAYNREAVQFITSRFPKTVFETPAELRLDELVELDNKSLELNIYGYQRVMQSAQCVINNKFGCDKSNRVHTLKDDKGNIFYSVSCCEECIGLIYNGVPYSLLGRQEELITKGLKYVSVKLDFTIEDRTETDEVMNCFIAGGRLNELSTTGHIYRGVE